MMMDPRPSSRDNDDDNDDIYVDNNDDICR